MQAGLNIRWEVTDPDALREKAGSDYCVANAHDPDAFDEATRLFGEPGGTNVLACIRQLHGRDLPDDGLRILETTVSVQRRAQLRPSVLVNVSVEHITPEELARINEAFGMEAHGPTYRAFEDISHDGLYMSPKDHGFFVRTPSDERIDEVLAGLTPEMAGIVRLAYDQGANRIEFDADEAAIDGLPTFEH